jgi:alkyl hydroperoxide reductase subunit F
VALQPAGEAGGLVERPLDSGATLQGEDRDPVHRRALAEMNVPGENEYRNKGVAYCPHCDGPLFKGKRVAVIGGGNSGVEAAIDLAGIVAHVTLLEFDGKLRADEVLQRKLRSLPNVRVHRQRADHRGAGDGRQGRRPGLQDRATARSTPASWKGMFVQIGLLPNTDWLKGTVSCRRAARSIVDDRGHPACRACSPPATAPPCRTSRS